MQDGRTVWEELVRLLGHAAGGRPAERLMTPLGMPMSDDTILRHLKRRATTSTSTQPVLRVVGIDGVDGFSRPPSRYQGVVIIAAR